MRRFPYFAKCIREMELASFTSAYSIYIAGAADTEQSFDAASALVEDRKLKEELRRCRGKIAEGISFSRAAMEEELYPPLYGRMLLNGERAGKGEESIFYLADKEWEQAEERLDAAIRGIEPILSIVITACVGILLITMMLPLISMMNAIG